MVSIPFMYRRLGTKSFLVPSVLFLLVVFSVFSVGALLLRKQSGNTETATVAEEPARTLFPLGNLEESIDASPSARLSMANGALGKRAAKYDQEFIEEAFGVSKVGKFGVLVTGAVKVRNESNIVVNYGFGEFEVAVEHPVQTTELSDYSCDTANSCPVSPARKISYNDIAVGDLVSLVINKGEEDLGYHLVGVTRYLP